MTHQGWFTKAALFCIVAVSSLAVVPAWGDQAVGSQTSSSQIAGHGRNYYYGGYPYGSYYYNTPRSGYYNSYYYGNPYYNGHNGYYNNYGPGLNFRIGW